MSDRSCHRFASICGGAAVFECVQSHRNTISRQPGSWRDAGSNPRPDFLEDSPPVPTRQISCRCQTRRMDAAMCEFLLRRPPDNPVPPVTGLSCTPSKSSSKRATTLDAVVLSSVNCRCRHRKSGHDSHRIFFEFARHQLAMNGWPQLVAAAGGAAAEFDFPLRSVFSTRSQSSWSGSAKTRVKA